MKKNLLKRDGVQSLIASLLCVVLGLLIGYIVLLIINPSPPFGTFLSGYLYVYIYSNFVSFLFSLLI